MLYKIKPNNGTTKNEDENFMIEFCRMIFFQMSVLILLTQDGCMDDQL